MNAPDDPPTDAELALLLSMYVNAEADPAGTRRPPHESLMVKTIQRLVAEVRRLRGSEITDEDLDAIEKVALEIKASQAATGRTDDGRVVVVAEDVVGEELVGIPWTIARRFVDTVRMLRGRVKFLEWKKD